jgi:hypothetical protein
VIAFAALTVNGPLTDAPFNVATIVPVASIDVPFVPTVKFAVD